MQEMPDTSNSLSHEDIEKKTTATSRIFFVAVIAALAITPFLFVLANNNNSAPSTLKWETDYEAAMLTAARGNKLILLDFTADWCQPCKMLNETVFNQSEFSELVESHFVPVKVDMTENIPLLINLVIS